MRKKTNTPFRSPRSRGTDAQNSRRQRSRVPEAEPATRRGRTRQASAEIPAERLHKALAQAGLASRREAEEWIAAGRVQVNGEVAGVGAQVRPGDKVKVNGRLVTLHFSDRLPRVLIYHKPEGEIVSRDDPEGRPNVFNALPRLRGGRWVAVGRLDINTSGLLLFTTSGELANRLMHPGAGLIREYAARILGDFSDEARQQLLEGVALEDGEARFHTLEDAGGQGANHWYRVSLYEGKNREVRRLFEAVGVRVSRLTRVRYGPFILPPRLKRGHTMELTPAETERLMRLLKARDPEDGDGENPVLSHPAGGMKKRKPRDFGSSRR
ncbi:MAG: pseudouridine synthase [Zoogloeaceae bacterium]|nr:pseudouridine synthase [Zoogloeaceae bacterium]